jgi:ABC-type lipoprotein export system ATPase subunit
MKISKKTKSTLFEILKESIYQPDAALYENWILDFLNSIWDLKSLPSEDNRFKNADEDVWQHLINNDDWDYDYLFIERLGLLENDSDFIKFLETFVYPKYRLDENEIVKYVLLINSYIEKDDLNLILSEYDDDGLPIYLIKVKQEDELPIDIPENRTIFYLEKNATVRSNRFSSHSEPITRPAFVLVYNNRWNDYSNWTDFDLFYYGNNDDKLHIGNLKITDGKTQSTIEVLPTHFINLNKELCSLGQDYEYYTNLKEVTGKNFYSVLYALKDSAFFPEIQDKFAKKSIFRQSLIRADSVERLMRVAKYRIYGFDLNNLYSFKYFFTPKYTKDSVEVFFDFNNKGNLSNRIYAIIGKNGTGKTQLITLLPIAISQSKQDYFSPRAPMFSKVIAVSYSIFDNFEIPRKTSSFNYIYCGLLDEKGELLNPRQQVMRFHNTWKKIKELQRMNKWRKILLNFIDVEMIDTFIVENEKDDEEIYDVSVDGFNKIKNQLSSGQSIILYIISEIVSNIRLDSLVLFDEPETHLHPNAISQLMNTIFKLVHEFESYCIVTTHSPLVIQELFSKNVYVIERHENVPSIRKIGVESFGENLSVLTEEVFGNKEIERQYKKIIDNLVNLQKSYSEIVSDLELNNMPLSLNARLYIKSKTTE